MERESDGARVAACARRLWGRVTRVARRAETLRLVEECCGAPRLGSQASAAGEISSSTPRLRPNTWTTSSFRCSGASAGGVGQPGGALRLATLGIHVAGDGAGPHVAAQPRLRRGGAGAAQRTGVEPSRLRQQCHSGRPYDGGLKPAVRTQAMAATAAPVRRVDEVAVAPPTLTGITAAALAWAARGRGT
jgi:hypothetical protein